MQQRPFIHLPLVVTLTSPCAAVLPNTAGTHDNLSDTTPPVVQIHTPVNEATITRKLKCQALHLTLGEVKLKFHQI